MKILFKTSFWHIGYNEKLFRVSLPIVIVFLITLLAPNQALARNKDSRLNTCNKTAIAAFNACRKEIRSDLWIELGNCYNITDPEEREECIQEAKEAFREALKECKEQFEARLEICDALGGGPYDPQINPDDFVDPANIGTSITPNQYFPLVRGYKWVYRNEDAGETITDEVLDETKEILGVTCAVVHDVVETEEGVTEDTYDWYAQDKDGNVWYFGEISKEFEDGDLVSIEGSWKAGVDGAKPGIIMFAEPTPGDIYRQEFSLGNAEDMAEIVSIGEDVTYSYDNKDYTYNGVLKTRDFTPLEPDVNEFKYYAPGVGVVLEENPETGEQVKLIEFTNH